MEACAMSEILQKQQAEKQNLQIHYKLELPYENKKWVTKFQ